MGEGSTPGQQHPSLGGGSAEEHREQKLAQIESKGASPAPPDPLGRPKSQPHWLGWVKSLQDSNLLRRANIRVGGEIKLRLSH